MEAGDLTSSIQSLWVPEYLALLPLLPSVPAIYQHQETRCQLP